MGLEQAAHFLEHVVKSTANPLPALAQARSALMVLYDEVLGIPLGELPQPRLLDQLRLVLRVRHYSRRPEDCYANWARRFILFHRKRHPRTMGAAEVEQFLTHLAVQGRISASASRTHSRPSSDRPQPVRTYHSGWKPPKPVPSTAVPKRVTT